MTRRWIALGLTVALVTLGCESRAKRRAKCERVCDKLAADARCPASGDNCAQFRRQHATTCTQECDALWDL